MERVQQVINFVTTNGCLARGLATHFSDQDTIPKSGCGTCSFCITRKRVEYLPSAAQQRKGRIDESKITAILSATKVRDDARFLARTAFGFSSPRITAEKLNKHPVFGSMTDCNFEVWRSVIDPLSSDFKLTIVPSGTGGEVQDDLQRLITIWPVVDRI